MTRNDARAATGRSWRTYFGRRPMPDSGGPGSAPTDDIADTQCIRAVA